MKPRVIRVYGYWVHCRCSSLRTWSWTAWSTPGWWIALRSTAASLKRIWVCWRRSATSGCCSISTNLTSELKSFFLEFVDCSFTGLLTILAIKYWFEVQIQNELVKICQLNGHIVSFQNPFATHFETKQREGFSVIILTNRDRKGTEIVFCRSQLNPVERICAFLQAPFISAPFSRWIIQKFSQNIFGFSQVACMLVAWILLEVIVRRLVSTAALLTAVSEKHRKPFQGFLKPHLV